MTFPQLPDPRSVTVNGANLAYREQGQGAAWVFVHGDLSDLRTWDQRLPAFSSAYRTLTYSRGYARPNPEIPPGVQNPIGAHVEDLAAFLEATGAAPAHLVGNSWGAFICLLTAIRHPYLVRTLVREEPPVAPSPVGLRTGARRPVRADAGEPLRPQSRTVRRGVPAPVQWGSPLRRGTRARGDRHPHRPRAALSRRPSRRTPPPGPEIRTFLARTGWPHPHPRGSPWSRSTSHARPSASHPLKSGTGGTAEHSAIRAESAARVRCRPGPKVPQASARSRGRLHRGRPNVRVSHAHGCPRPREGMGGRRGVPAGPGRLRRIDDALCGETGCRPRGTQQTFGHTPGRGVPR